MFGHKKMPRPWSISDKEFLHSNRTLTHKEAAEKLDRTPESIRKARATFGAKFVGKSGPLIAIVNIERGEAIRDQEGPDVTYEAGSRDCPCRRCWNAEGTKMRWGCFKCEERIKYDEEVSHEKLNLCLSFDYTDSRLMLPHNRGACR